MMKCIPARFNICSPVVSKLALGRHSWKDIETHEVGDSGTAACAMFVCAAHAKRGWLPQTFASHISTPFQESLNRTAAFQTILGAPVEFIKGSLVGR